MPQLDDQIESWYNGKTHACISGSVLRGPDADLRLDKVEGCGQIVPLRDSQQHAQYGNLYACVRTETMEVKCGDVQKLYTPNVFFDNWGWFALALIIAWVLYDDHKNAGSES